MIVWQNYTHDCASGLFNSYRLIIDLFITIILYFPYYKSWEISPYFYRFVFLHSYFEILEFLSFRISNAYVYRASHTWNFISVNFNTVRPFLNSYLQIFAFSELYAFWQVARRKASCTYFYLRSPLSALAFRTFDSLNFRDFGFPNLLIFNFGKFANHKWYLRV